MLYFKNRLKKLRKEKNITQKDLADILGYSRSTIAKYESGQRLPSNNFLIDVADYFEVSLDYMLGRTDIKLSLSEYLVKYSQNILLFVNSENGRIIGQSPDASEFYGYTEKELLNMKIDDILTMSKEKASKILKEAVINKHKVFYLTNILKDGSNKEVKATTTNLLIGEEKIIALLIQDIANIKIRSEYEDKIESLILILNEIANKKIPYKYNYAKNVSDLSYMIGQNLALENGDLKILKRAALLHDIGELNTPLEIINKPTPLSKAEYDLLKMHVIYSVELIENTDFDNKIKKIILQHHERLDGSGYPNGLKNNEILKEAKIIAVADSVIAMLSERPYRTAYDINQALKEIQKQRNIKYDKDIVDIVVEVFKNNLFNLRH